ncbi:hypothetical protein CEXT_334161 [Caerostris extrusa]|uniref:Uncharacterized protein n=1 Tax=Caerostris extrusa TaxID=172846 RepID=A0AAV4XWB9_CAEEX|nr:hypothetical protein CEXT_334161 [Caerostris extrusa]
MKNSTCGRGQTIRKKGSRRHQELPGCPLPLPHPSSSERVKRGEIDTRPIPSRIAPSRWNILKGPLAIKRAQTNPGEFAAGGFSIMCVGGIKVRIPARGQGVFGEGMRFGNGAIKPGSGWTETKESGFPGLICKRTVFRRCLAEWVVQPLIFQGIS